MNTQKIIYLVAGVIVGFAVGFIFANGVNRKEQDAMRAELTRLRAAAPPRASSSGDATNLSAAQASAPDSSDQNLTMDELRRAVAKGDASPGDIALQRKLGEGLYLYAMNVGDPTLLPDAARMLKRAYEANPKDYETLVLLGNVLFDTGQNSGDPARFAEARSYYQKALDIKPDDVNVRTDLGLTYYFDRPPDAQRAIKEYRKSLALDPRHEMTLQNIASALVATSQLDEARKRVEELEKVNPQNAALPNLRAQLMQKANASRQSGAPTSEAQN